MKIFYTIHQFFPTYYTGTERYLYNLSKMMQKYGHQVHIVTYQPNFEEDMTKIDGLYIKNYIYNNLDITAIHIPGNQPYISFELENKIIFNFFYKLLKKEKPDILHITHPMRMTQAFDAAKALKIKTVMTLTDYWLMCGKGILLKNNNMACMGPGDGTNCKKYCYQQLSKNILKNRVKKGKNIFNQINKLIISAKFVSDLYQLNEYDTSKIEIIRHGFNYFDNYQPIKNGSIKKDFCFGSLGSLIPNKGANILIQAFKMLKNKNIKLKIYGDTTWDKEYFSYLKKLQGNDKRITFEGKYSLTDTAKIHSELDVVVQPSLWYETYPLVCVTSLAYGIPIIVPDLTGSRELVEDKKNGYIFKFGNAKSLQQKMEQAYNQKMKYNSSIFYNHSVEEESFLTEKLYLNLINETKK
ncbi:MAG: glycosyltransferase [Candidatus Shapirobacteria bacterium]|nr:glycosyltransferase [Candidatus Shapirobacteria bacterium]MDD4410517.1 glycosyltransferase [Candidatus Shapirobacteria bacterium]